MAPVSNKNSNTPDLDWSFSSLIEKIGEEIREKIGKIEDFEVAEENAAEDTFHHEQEIAVEETLAKKVYCDEQFKFYERVKEEQKEREAEWQREWDRKEFEKRELEIAAYKLETEEYIRASNVRDKQQSEDYLRSLKEEEMRMDANLEAQIQAYELENGI